MPEQEFPPHRPSAGSYRPGRPGLPDRRDDDRLPWADLPPVRPAPPRRPPGGSDPVGPGRPVGGGRPPGRGPAGPGRPVDPARSFGASHPADLLDPMDPVGPRRGDQVPPWARPDVDDEEDVPRKKPREPGGRAIRAAARRRRRWFAGVGSLVVV